MSKMYKCYKRSFFVAVDHSLFRLTKTERICIKMTWNLFLHQKRIVTGRVISFYFLMVSFDRCRHSILFIVRFFTHFFSQRKQMEDFYWPLNMINPHKNIWWEFNKIKNYVFTITMNIYKKLLNYLPFLR